MRRTRIVHEEVRHYVDGDVGRLEGYAVKFNRYSQTLWGFVEQIAPGAAATSINEKANSTKNDIRGTYNHRQILARQATESLKVFEDGEGIKYEIDLNLNIASHRDVMEMVKTKLVTGSSFGFRVIEETWSETEAEFPLVTVNEMELFDVGPVDFPAYLDSEATTRDLVRLRSFLEAHGHGPELASLELSEEANSNDFNSYLDEIRSRSADEESVVAAPRLNIARRRMDLPGVGRNRPTVGTTQVKE